MLHVRKTDRAGFDRDQVVVRERTQWALFHKQLLALCERET